MLAHSKNSTKAAALARQLTASAKTKLDAAQGHSRFHRRKHPPCRAVVHRSAVARTFRRRHDAGRRLRPCCRPRHFVLRDADGRRFSAGICHGLRPAAHCRHHQCRQSFPLPDDFQTPLVRFTLDGDDYYLNDTDQYSELGTTAFDDKLGIALASQKMETIKAAKNCGNKTETDYAISLADDGKARIKISTHFYGEDYNQRASIFRRTAAGGTQPLFSGSRFARRPGRAGRRRFDDQIRHLSRPGEFTVDVDDYSVTDGKYFYFDLPFTPSFFSAGADQRSLPMFISDGRER